MEFLLFNINKYALFSSLVSICLIPLVYLIIFNYWTRCGIPQIVKHSAVLEFRTDFIGSGLSRAYQAIRYNGHKHAGLYFGTQPLYLSVAPDILKGILQKDFGNFTGKGFYYNEKDDPLSANLFALGGEKWRYIRTKMTPSFTLGKIKALFNTMIECGNQLQMTVENVWQKGETLEMKEMAARYTIDIIGSCVYGLDCNSCKNTNSEFTKQAKDIFQVSFARKFIILCSCSSPYLARLLGVKVFSPETINFFVELVKSAIAYRKRTSTVRKDILQTLMQLLEKDENGKCLTIEQVSGQAFLFFAAGFETSSTTIAFCLYELSRNQEIQDKLRNAILTKLKDELQYDVVMEMKYLDQVINETLRKYPPVSHLTRVCQDDYKIPQTDCTLPKGTQVLISILGLHRDPEYYPEPERFNPERFNSLNKQNIKPYTYLPFGEGPRICIGLKFGLLQVKIGLISLLRRYKFSLNSKTKEPIEMDPNSFTMVSKTGIYLNIEKIDANV